MKGNLNNELRRTSALFGIYGSHSVDACPFNNRENAKKVVALAGGDQAAMARKYKINKVVGQYHSGLEHTFLWIVDAEAPHLIQRFCIESGVASFNTLKIVPLVTFAEGVVPIAKEMHGL